MMDELATALFFAVGIDFVLGDPAWLPHPVIIMGRLIQRSETFLRRLFAHHLVPAGFFLWLIVVGTSFFLTYFLLRTAYFVHPLLGFMFQVILMWTAISTRCLAEEGKKVYHAVRSGDLKESRRKISYLVGRDTTNLSFPEIIRATVETIAENTVDGTIAPMFYGIIGGAPLMIAYKACNTLDSMVGYKNDAYLEFGRCSAIIDDLVNYIPARISLLFISLSAFFSGFSAKDAWRIGLRDRRNHLSPNSAWAESAFAGAIGIQLGGTNVYFGKKVEKPTIGDAKRELEAEDILRSNRLLFVTTFITLILFLSVRSVAKRCL